jgi:hypothetical protein
VQRLYAHLGDDSRPGLFQLRVTERSLRLRLHALDDRVQWALAADDGLGTNESVSEVDVLCASILELRELLDETRTEIAREVAALSARRDAPRRWN